MPNSPQNLAQEHTVTRLTHLLRALQEAKKKFETFAGGIKNTQLHQAVIGLAVENNQYASELIALIRSLGGETAISDLEAEKKLAKSKVAEKNVLDACEKSEKRLLKVYHEVLNESYIYDNLKKMLSYQLNGVMGAFQRLKLLNGLQKE